MKDLLNHTIVGVLAVIGAFAIFTALVMIAASGICPA